MMKPRIIALSGDMHHGKSTVAKYLRDTYGVKRHRFAGPIKDMTVALLVAAGEAPEHARRSVEDANLKNLPIRELFGLSSRGIQRKLGDMGRSISPLFWANLVVTSIQVQERDEPYGIYVVDDWRYRHGEGDRLLASDVQTTFVRVNRPGVPPAVRDHDSEGGLDDWPFDFVINNVEDDIHGLELQADDLFDMVNALGVA
jgi:hypothetical protein